MSDLQSKDNSEQKNQKKDSSENENLKKDHFGKEGQF